MGFDLKSMVLDPLRGGRQEEVQVPEWEGAHVIVRAPSAGDYIAWRQALREAGQVTDDDTEETAREKIMRADLSPASALLLSRVLLVKHRWLFWRRTGRILSNADIPNLAASWTPVHERLLEKSLKLSGIIDEADAKNGLAESPTSAS